MKDIFLRTAYNYDTDQASLESGLLCDDVSLAKQSFAEEADINTLVRRFNLTGELPQNVVVPQYADFEAIFDFHSAMNVVAAANEAFDLMPADVRSRFQNDPSLFVDFVNDPNNALDCVKMGLATIREPEPSIPPAGVVATASGPTGGASAPGVAHTSPT